MTRRRAEWRGRPCLGWHRGVVRNGAGKAAAMALPKLSRASGARGGGAAGVFPGTAPATGRVAAFTATDDISSVDSQLVSANDNGTSDHSSL